MKGTPVDATIVIPTFNRRDALLETLGALTRMIYPTDRWEAVVVDDGSTDDTERAVRQWIEDTGAPVRCLRQENRGPAAARNRGAAEALGKALIFIDNDIVVDAGFVRDHLETLMANPGCWVLGRVIQSPVLKSTPFGRYRDALHESFNDAYQPNRLSETDWVTTQNLSAPAADFKRLGGFDESFTIASCEDWELAWRARQAGIRVLYHPGIAVLHNDWAVSLDRFCERQKLYSISDVLLWQKYHEASPRARLVCENAPVKWNQDHLGLVIKKMLKRALATSVGERLVRAACQLAERWAPDSRWNRRAYEIAVATAIFRGVREGWRRYASVSTSRDLGQLEQA